MSEQKTTRRTALAAAGVAALAVATNGKAQDVRLTLPMTDLGPLKELVAQTTAKTASKEDVERAMGWLCAMGWLIAYGTDSDSETPAFQFTDACYDHYGSQGEGLNGNEVARHTHNLLGSLFQTIK
jgi:hypothetical protein